MVMSSTDEWVAARIRELRTSRPGPMLAILNGDHPKKHVLAEMLALRDVTRPGDYLIVEDANISGDPVYGAFGPGLMNPWTLLLDLSRRLFPRRKEARQVRFHLCHRWLFDLPLNHLPSAMPRCP
jgi:hypothetical protein